MRRFLFALLVLGLAGCASAPKETIRSVTIQDIKPRYIEEQQFKRIGEYWSGGEVTGKRLILRSDPQSRSGFYFVLILDEKVRALPKGTTIQGEFYTAASPDIQSHTFTLPSDRPKTREIFVGLTGADWPVRDAVPGAWRFTIKTPNGDLLGQKQSYLWEL
jgi:hypothetical protein